jgi:nitroreductase
MAVAILSRRRGVDVFQAMRELRAMRRIKPDPVPTELIREIVEYGTYAPTASNEQDWRFIVVSEPPPHQERGAWERQRKALLWQAQHLAEIPVLIFACTRIPLGADFAVTRRHSSTNGSIWPAIQNMLLVCRARGLGATATTLHLVHEEEVNALLGLPEDVRSFAMLPIGWPMGKFGPVRRRPVDEVMSWNGWE